MRYVNIYSEDRELVDKLGRFVEEYQFGIMGDVNWPTAYQDHLALAYLIKKFEIKSILEIGVWKGATSGLFCKMDEVEKVKGIDINQEMNVKYTHNGHPLSNPEFYGQLVKSPKFSLEFADTKQVEPKEQFDMVFIDGNHTEEYIANDTLLALKYKPKIIVWHDYAAEPEVTDYLNKNELNLNIEVIGSSIVAYAII